MHLMVSRPVLPSRVPGSLTPALLHAIIELGWLLLLREWTVENDKKDKARASSIEDLGAKVGRGIGEAANQIEKESERLIAYINSEVVPAVRGESTTALRTAAEKLKQFADYLDDRKRNK
jgi:hypothetical protein